MSKVDYRNKVLPFSLFQKEMLCKETQSLMSVITLNAFFFHMSFNQIKILEIFR